MSSYLFSSDGYLDSLVTDNDLKIVYVQSDNDIKKAIELIGEEFGYEINFESIVIDRPLKKVSFKYKYYWDTQYEVMEYKLIEITKP